MSRTGSHLQRNVVVVLSLCCFVVALTDEDKQCNPNLEACELAERPVGEGIEESEVANMNVSLLQRKTGFQSERLSAGSGALTLAPAQSMEELQTKKTHLLNELAEIGEELGTFFPNSDSIMKAAEKAFDQIQDQGGDLTKNLTPEEVARYRQRFLETFVGITRIQPASFAKMVMKALDDEQPAITKFLVDAVNAAKLGWEAALADWGMNLSMRDVRTLMGFIPGSETEQLSMMDSSLNASAWMNETVPANFDARQRWSMCANEIAHMREQGHCGSCWAQASATALDGRLCISSGGKFKGANAWISAGYITSCFSGHADGCQGGNPLTAFKYIKARGTPTGNDGQCVPYFASGDSLQHFTQKDKSPACPRSCTNRYGYARPLSQDLFYANNAVYTTSLPQAQQAIYNGGGIIIGFTVYDDFMSYRRGYYTPHSHKTVGGHAVAVIGWNRYQNNIYLILVNSWGTTWGERGLAKIRGDCCGIKFYIPSGMPRSQGALPLPFSSTDNACEKDTGGTCMFFGCDRSRNAVCEAGQCLCKSGCASHGRCVGR